MQVSPFKAQVKYLPLLAMRVITYSNYMISKFLTVILFVWPPVGGAISLVNKRTRTGEPEEKLHLSDLVYYENCSHPMVAMNL